MTGVRGARCNWVRRWRHVRCVRRARPTKPGPSCALGTTTPFGQSRGGTPEGERVPLDASRNDGCGAWTKCAYRRSASFDSLIAWLSRLAWRNGTWRNRNWRNGVANNKRQAPPLPFPSHQPASRFHVVALAKLGRKNAPREREYASMDENELARRAAVSLVVSSATSKAAKRKPKLGAAEYAVRFALEKVLQQSRYCDAFALWRRCRRKSCRRQGACGGDANDCLRRGLGRVPRHVQRRVREDILKSTPRNIGAPERKARQYMPGDFYKQDIEKEMR
jgi:hypothetical protein